MNFNLSSKCLACVVSIAVAFNSFSSAAFASESTRPKKGKDSPVVSSSSGPLAVTSGNAAHELVRQCALPGANVTEISNQLFRLFIANPALGPARNEDGLTPLDLALTLGCPVEVECLCYAYRYPFDGTHSVKERKEYWSSIRDFLPRVPSGCLIGFLNKFDNEKDMAEAMRCKVIATARTLQSLSLCRLDFEVTDVFWDDTGWAFYYYVLFNDFEMAESFFKKSRDNYFAHMHSRGSSCHIFDNPILSDPSLVIWVPLIPLIVIKDVDMTRQYLDMIKPYVDVKNKRWRKASSGLAKNVLIECESEDMKRLFRTHPLTKDVCKFLK